MPLSDSIPDDFDAALRSTAERRGAFGTPTHYFAELPSTNDLAAGLAERGANEGTVVMAAAQTAGRGRFGRDWFSPPGAGLYFSIVCRNAPAAPYLTLAGGVAVAEGIRAAAALPVEIKWPNDIVVDAGRGRRRKLAGILAEGSTTGHGLQHVILGIGINLNAAAYPPEIAGRATSIETELGRPPDAAAVFAETLASLAATVASLARGGVADMLTRWRQLAPSAVGATVEWDSPSGPRSGRTLGIDDDGALLVRVDGGVERIIAGELRWG
jgi:BirA family biotin operon repressor/biotin-[acetyl-CoA-carboxylase] ligase